MATILRIALTTVTKKPDHRGEHGVSRKTVVQGMPDRSGEPVVTNLRVFYFARKAAGEPDHPAFPAPSVEGFLKTRASGAAGTRSHGLRRCERNDPYGRRAKNVGAPEPVVTAAEQANGLRESDLVARGKIDLSSYPSLEEISRLLPIRQA